jgi:hypothetical protein
MPLLMLLVIREAVCDLMKGLARYTFTFDFLNSRTKVFSQGELIISNTLFPLQHLPLYLSGIVLFRLI